MPFMVGAVNQRRGGNTRAQELRVKRNLHRGPCTFNPFYPPCTRPLDVVKQTGITLYQVGARGAWAAGA